MKKSIIRYSVWVIFIISFMIIILGLLWFYRMEKSNTIPGNTENTIVTLGSSKRFTQEELEDAVRIVKQKFSGFHNATLLNIWFSEDHNCNHVHDVSISDTDIVLCSNFKTGLSDNNGFVQNTLITGWSWILRKNTQTGGWTLINQGY